ncbi:MAG: nickel pincer cofactor biosynthesis protein LarC [Planctomycetota bacterium]
MQQVHLDLFSGVAGDMLVAGLLDAGAPEKVLEKVLASLPQEFTWERKRESRQGIAGLRFVVAAREGHVHRRLDDVIPILEKAALSPRARAWARDGFKELAEAEARAHGTTPDEVFFHEVGAVDAIVDVAAACALMDAFDPAAIWASPVAVGSGFVACAHGRMPVPAPGTQALLQGMPVCGRDLEGERTTPTGAALLRAWKVRFGSRPPAVPLRVGHGLGGRDPEDVPNFLRVVVEHAEGDAEELVELRTLVDDQSGEVVASALQALHEAGAVEAFALPAVAKKNRPAFEIVVLCERAAQPAFEEQLFRHLGTLGLRVSPVRRTRRPRRVEVRPTPLGPLPFKLREDPQGTTVLKPEFEALRQRALELGLTPREALERVDREDS